MTEDRTYPEHEKMHAVKEESQAIGTFLEWLTGEKHFVIGQYHEHTDACYEEGHRQSSCGCAENMLYPAFSHCGYNVNKLLAEYFGIDLDKIEEEKEAMLEAIRADHRR